MESLKTVKLRINSIKSTKQITQSMRTVSTIKAKKIRLRMNQNLAFLKESKGLADAAAKSLDGTVHHYTSGHKKNDDSSLPAAVIVIGSDRGLCGGYNINIGKKLSELVKMRGDCKIITIGTKIKDYCRIRYNDMIAEQYSGISENPLYDDAAQIAAIVLEMYNKQEIDEIYIIRTRFESMLSQKAEVIKLLPHNSQAGVVISDDAADSSKTAAVKQEESGVRSVASFEPAGEKLLETAIPFYITAYIFGAILESSLCEQSSRVAGMDAAVKNAEEMIERLTTLYNLVRQGAITQEIIEIVNGADAV